MQPPQGQSVPGLQHASDVVVSSEPTPPEYAEICDDELSGSDRHGGGGSAEEGPLSSDPPFFPQPAPPRRFPAAEEPALCDDQSRGLITKFSMFLCIYEV